MGIRTVKIERDEVSCQRCPATIVVDEWRDAADSGWCVPSDGHLQLCPTCLASHPDTNERQSPMKIDPGRIACLKSVADDAAAAADAVEGKPFGTLGGTPFNGRAVAHAIGNALAQINTLALILADVISELNRETTP
jgi:hypothetical protein